MDVIEAIKTRRSISRFQKRPSIEGDCKQDIGGCHSHAVRHEHAAVGVYRGCRMPKNICVKLCCLQPDFAPALQEMQKISYENRQYLSARAFLERYLGVAKHTPKPYGLPFKPNER